jgi:hypothetical protein
LVPTIYRANDPRSLASPGEAALRTDSNLKSVTIDYPPAENRLGGLSAASWSMFLCSMVFGFALRRPMGVQF